MLLQNLETQRLNAVSAILERDQIQEELVASDKTVRNLKNEIEKSYSIERMASILEANYVSENNWLEIFFHFDKIYSNYTAIIKARFKSISKNDLKLIVLIRLDYSNKSIANINNVSEAAVKKAKQRLLKKLNIQSFEELVTEFRDVA